LAHKVFGVIKKCIEDSIPWTITPATGIESLSRLWYEFANEYVSYTKRDNSASIGIVDAATIFEARRLKKERKKRISKVHIWTKDRTLKSHEPDKESDSFVN